MIKNQNIHVLSRAVIVNDGHILLAYDPRDVPMHYYELMTPFYYLPGGHIEYQESVEAALQREMVEETGYEAHIEDFLGVVEYSWNFPGDEVCCHTHEINLIFKAKFTENIGISKISQKEEHVALKWIPLSQLQSIDLRPEDLKELIPEWLGLEA